MSRVWGGSGGLAGAPAGWAKEWPTYDRVSQDFAISWNSKGVVSADFPISWDIREFVSQDFDLSWNSRGVVENDFALTWNVQSDTEVSYTEFLNWLRELDALRCILVELECNDGTKTTKYCSNIGYISEPDQSLASTAFPDILTGIPSISRSIDGEFSISGIEIFNDGTLDDWLDYAWVGYDITIKMGSPDWNYDDFRTVIQGVNMGISAQGNNTLSFSLHDKREFLRVPVVTTLTPNNEPDPLSIGDPLNVEPVLEDAPTLLYRYHEDGAAVCAPGTFRDNGVAILGVDNADGTFTLPASPAGRITCDPTGVTNNSPAAVIEWLALRASKIGSGDIDSANLALYPTTPAVSLYVREQTDILDLIDQVAQSTGGVMIFNRLGQMQLVRLDEPGTSVAVLYEDDILEFGLSLSEIEQPYQRVQLNHSKNWAVQDADSLAGAVSAANRDRYSKEYETSAASTGVSLGVYPLAEDPEPVDTVIDNVTDADAEAARRAGLRDVKRKLFNIEATATPFQIQLGDTITVHYPRFGFENGLDCVVVGTTHELTNNRMQLTVWL